MFVFPRLFFPLFNFRCCFSYCFVMSMFAVCWHFISIVISTLLNRCTHKYTHNTHSHTHIRAHTHTHNKIKQMTKKWNQARKHIPHSIYTQIHTHTYAHLGRIDKLFPFLSPRQLCVRFRVSSLALCRTRCKRSNWAISDSINPGWKRKQKKGIGLNMVRTAEIGRGKEGGGRVWERGRGGERRGRRETDRDK